MDINSHNQEAIIKRYEVMMQTSLMCEGDVVNFLIKKHQSIPAVEPNQKIIPLVGAIGSFEYNIANDEIICDEINRLMVGLDNNVYSFADVLLKVEDKTRFQEQTIGYRGNESIVESSSMIFENGNIITATYEMIYEKDIGLVGMKGKSALMQVA